MNQLKRLNIPYAQRLVSPRVGQQSPIEVATTDRREKELSDLGFIGLCYRKESDSAAFFGGQTANKLKVYLEETATANRGAKPRDRSGAGR